MSAGSFQAKGGYEATGRGDAAWRDAQGGQRLVVLVGRTPGEAPLRAHSEVRVVRVTSVLEAIGELSLPDERGSASVVVLGASALSEAPGPELADAIRLADPRVQILATGEGAGGPWCDGKVAGGSDAEAAEVILRAAGVRPEGDRAAARHDEDDATPYPVVKPGAGQDLASRPPRQRRDDRGAAPRREAPAADVGATVEARSFASVRPGASLSPASDEEDVSVSDVELGDATPEADPGVQLGSGWDVGDRGLVSAVLKGGDVLTPALETLRRRVNRRDVDFLPADAAANGDDDTRLGVPVVWEGRPLGMLVAGDADRATLAGLSPHAAWLAGWLRLSRQSKNLRRAAFTDPLTGAWNRRYFDRYLDAAIAKARQDRLSLTVLLFDVDNFKGFNDRYGHPAGDEILVETVRVLRSVIRPSDRVCRIGGDEFAVIFFEPEGPRNPSSRPPESVYVLTKRVQQKIREREFPKLGREAAGRLTFSGGLATYPWDGADAETLLCRADELAIQSKRAGKNAITFGPGADRINGPEPLS
ncbi:MAG: GGDEF domain-containing protein [Planctomycetota bacterium]